MAFNYHLGYDPDKDYSLAILAAKTETERAALRRERENKIMDRYGGNMRCATAAYHAGQGTVDKWLKNPEYSSDGMTLNVIPYDSTNTYVDRVMKYYDYYSLEYEKLTIE